MPPVNTPLSGDVTGMASNRPEGSAVIPKKSQTPKGVIPAAATVERTAPAEETVIAPAPPPEALASAPTEEPAEETAPARSPASEEINPFAEPATQPVVAPEDNPFLEKPVPPPQVDRSAMHGYVNTNLAAHKAMSSPAAPVVTEIQAENPISDFVHGIEAGLQISVSGLGYRQKMPDYILPEQADMAMRIGNQIGQLAGDLPAIVGGMLGGGALGSEVPVVGNVVGATAGAFAVPPAVRKMFMDHFQKGDITDRREFVARLMATTWEGIKGGTVGAATALTGGAVAPVAGKVAAAGSELVAMTTIGSALEGHLPTMQEFIDGAILLGGIKGVGHVLKVGQAPVQEKLQEIYAKTGETPAQIVERAKTDVELQQQLVAGNMQEPPQAAPSVVEHVEVKEPGAEGQPEKVLGVKTEIRDKTAAEMGLEKPLVAEDTTPLENLSAYSEAVQRQRSKIGKNGVPAKQSWSESLEKWYANSVDYLAVVGSAEELAKSRGADIDLNNSAEGKMRAARAYGDKAASIIVNGTEDAKTGAINGEGLDHIFKEMHSNGLLTDELRDYAIAKDVLGDRKHESGLRIDDAETIVKELEPRYKEYNDRINAFRNRLLDWAVEKGRYTAKQVAEWKAQDSYSPRMRAFEADMFGQTEGPGGRGIKERVGSFRDILDPIMQTKINTERLVKDVLINEARAKFTAHMEEGGLIDADGKWAESMPPVLKAVKGESKLAANQIRVFKDGKSKTYEGTPLLIDSLKRLEGNPASLDLTARIMRGVTNAVRIGVVSNPGFGLAHFLRGQFMAGVNSVTGLKPFIDPAIGLAEMVKGSEDFRKFISEGGGAGRYLDRNKGYLATDLAKADNEKAPIYAKAWNSSLNPIHYSEAFIRLTDTATKFAEYKRSLAKGTGEGEAMANSRMVTPDYANVGLQQSVLRTGVAFIGAHINSLDNMHRVIERDPIGALAKLSVISATSAALWYLNRNDEAIEALPDWQKNTYWNINISRFDPSYRGAKDATIVKIPKPWAPGIIFGSGVETALDEWFKPRPHEVQHFASAIMHSVAPEVVPNILQPVLDQYSNKQAFTGRPLVPEYKQKLLPEMQYTPYTSETAKALGKIIGYVPLVKDLGPSTDPLASPAVVENYIKSWGGTLGGWALKISDTAMRGGKLDSGKADPWQGTEVLRQFVSRYPSFQDQRIQDFYDNKDAADKAYNSAKLAAKKGDFEAAERIRKAHPDFQVRLNTIAKGISTARKTYEFVQEDPGIPAVQKRQLLDTMLFQIGTMAKEGNQMMSDFRRNQVQNSVKGN